MHQFSRSSGHRHHYILARTLACPTATTPRRGQVSGLATAGHRPPSEWPSSAQACQVSCCAVNTARKSSALVLSAVLVTSFLACCAERGTFLRLDVDHHHRFLDQQRYVRHLSSREGEPVVRAPIAQRPGFVQIGDDLRGNALILETVAADPWGFRQWNTEDPRGRGRPLRVRRPVLTYLVD